MKLTNLQLEKFADIIIIVGQVIFASTVIPFFVGVDKPDSSMLLSGWTITIACWVVSLIMVGRIKK